MATVLIVDDEESVRRLLGEMLTRSGHETLEAATGEEALERLIQRPVDLVLADVLMPGQGGLWMTAEIRRRYPSVPVILVTGVLDVEARITLMEGVVAYIVKPFDRPTLERATLKALKWREDYIARSSPKTAQLEDWFASEE